MFQIITKNPILIFLSLCLLLSLTAGIFFNGQYFSEYAADFTIISCLLALCSRSLSEALAAISFTLLCLILYFTLGIGNLFLLFGSLLLVVFVAWQRRKSENILLFAIVFISFLLHFHYIEITDVETRQHDLNGIMYYMRDITQNGFNFWDFNPWNMYYFFHQPFHFFVNGALYRFYDFIWHSHILVQECLQFLSLFYVTGIIIVTARILQMFNFPRQTFYAVFILLTFNPSFFLFSGYISNDVPVLFWAVSSLYYLLKWYKDEALNNLLISSICFGLGVLTKLSILMVVPVFLLLFLHKLYQNKCAKDILNAISLFVIIAVPLSLMWIMRNHILYDMDFYNIPDTSPAGQNFRYMTFFERILDFSLLGKPFIHSPLTNDSNMFLAIVKTELFGEWNLSLNHQIIVIPATILYFLNIIIKISAFGGCLFILTRAKKSSFLTITFALSYLIIWAYSFKYAMDYPYSCSSDYRLFAIMNLPELIILATICQNKVSSKILFTVAVTFALLGSFIYISL